MKKYKIVYESIKENEEDYTCQIYCHGSGEIKKLYDTKDEAQADIENLKNCKTVAGFSENLWTTYKYEIKEVDFKEFIETAKKEYEECLLSEEARAKLKKWREEHPEEVKVSNEINHKISEGVRKYNEMLHNGVEREVAWTYLMEVKASVQSKAKFPEIYDFCFLYPDMVAGF